MLSAMKQVLTFIQGGLRSVLGMCAISLVGGCTALPGDVSDRATVPQLPLATGMLGNSSNLRWRVEAWGNEKLPVLRVWDKTQAGASALIENRTFLPPDLLKPGSEWLLQSLSIKQNLLVVVLRYQPNPNAYQQKLFEFDLDTPRHTLVNYRVTTGRADKVDWQVVDFLARTSSFCRNAPQNNPDDCKPTQAPVLAEPLASLDEFGNAEDYVPPIKMDRQY